MNRMTTMCKDSRRALHTGSLLVLALLAACTTSTVVSSSYQPQGRGQIQEIIDEGRVVYVKNGTHFMELEQAVAGVQQAEEAAREYARKMEAARNSQKWRPWRWVAAGGILAGVATDMYGLRSDRPEVQTWGRGVGLISAAGFLLAQRALFAGERQAQRAAPLRHDAINLFNDGVGAIRAEPVLSGQIGCSGRLDYEQ